MEEELVKLKRRPFMFPLLLPVAVMAVVVLAAIWIWDMRATTVVVIVRHAEVDPGTNPDPDLNLAGREHAARLARVLASVQEATAQGNRTPGERGVDAVFASETRRSQQTAAPLAEAMSLPVNVVPAAGWSALPDRLLHDERGKVVLVVGRESTIPPLVDALTGDTVTVGPNDADQLLIAFVPRLSRPRLLQLHY